MTIDVRAETTIDTPREEVASFVMDPANDTKWIGGIKTARVVNGVQTGRGSQVERVASFMGRKVEYVNEVVEYDPPSKLVMQSVKSPFPMRVTYEFADDQGRTRASVRVEGDASGFYKIAGPVMAPMVKRNITKDLENLKATLEQR